MARTRTCPFVFALGYNSLVPKPATIGANGTGTVNGNTAIISGSAPGGSRSTSISSLVPSRFGASSGSAGSSGFARMEQE